MKFPPNHCIPTNLLTKETYSLFVCKVVTDGYVNMIPHLDYDLMIIWEYIGCGYYDELTTFSHPYSFMELNAWMKYRDVRDEDYPNTLDKEWLEKYLKND